jgi:peroxiredoxin
MIRRFLTIVLHLNLIPAAQGAIVSGTMKNGSAGQAVDVLVPHLYLDGKSDTYRGVLDGQQQFRIEAVVPEPQVVFLMFNGDRLAVYLEPVDTLVVKADMFQFPLSVGFGGRGGANNRFFRQYLQENPQDFNEFNNIRFKFGQWWAGIDGSVNNTMEELAPVEFKAWADNKKIAGFALLDEFRAQNPAALSSLFVKWLFADINYTWAYNMLFYGHVYAKRYDIQPEFFAFLNATPLVGDMIGNDTYRQFLMAYLAREQASSNRAGNFWVGQYQIAGDKLAGKALSFSRSEIIYTGFSGEQYRDMLPCYNHFLQTNPHPAFDAKVSEMYSKIKRVVPGAPAPVFTGKDINGESISLSRFRGNVVYLNFWASWCAACLKKMEFFDDYSPELKSRGIEIINVSIDENAGNWKTALEMRAFKGLHLLSSTGLNRDIGQEFGVEAIPQYFIIGKDGTFLEKPISGQPDDIRQRLLELAKMR